MHLGGTLGFTLDAGKTKLLTFWTDRERQSAFVCLKKRSIGSWYICGSLYIAGDLQVVGVRPKVRDLQVVEEAPCHAGSRPCRSVQPCSVLFCSVLTSPYLNSRLLGAKEGWASDRKVALCRALGHRRSRKEKRGRGQRRWRMCANDWQATLRLLSASLRARLTSARTHPRE